MLPKKATARALFWGSLPSLFLLFTVAIASLKSTLVIPYFPWIILTMGILSLRFKTGGIAISYTLLGALLLWQIAQTESSERLWLMGLFFNTALTLYIGLLASEEIEDCFHELQEMSEKQSASLLKMEEAILQAKQEGASHERELEEEIKKLKEEAEQRRIERVRDHNRFELIQSEIDLLTAQKEEFIKETRQARVDQQAAEQKASEAGETLRQMAMHSQEEIIRLQQRAPVVIEKEVAVSSEDPAKVIELEKAIKLAESHYAQLRTQFQEKGEILSQTRAEIYQLQGQLEVLEKENSSLLLNPDRSEAAALEQEVDRLISKIVSLEEEIAQLEAIISALT